MGFDFTVFIYLFFFLPQSAEKKDRKEKREVKKLLSSSSLVKFNSSALTPRGSLGNEGMKEKEEAEQNN